MPITSKCPSHKTTLRRSEDNKNKSNSPSRTRRRTGQESELNYVIKAAIVLPSFLHIMKEIRTNYSTNSGPNLDSKPETLGFFHSAARSAPEHHPVFTLLCTPQHYSAPSPGPSDCSSVTTSSPTVQ